MCSGPFSGSLPRPAPPVPLSKPRDGVLGALGLQPQHLGLSQASLTSGNGSPRPPHGIAFVKVQLPPVVLSSRKLPPDFKSKSPSYKS